MAAGKWNRLGAAMVPLMAWILGAFLIPAHGAEKSIFAPVVVIPKRVTVGNLPDGTLVMFVTQKGENGNDLFAKYSDDGLHWSEPVLLRRNFERSGAILFTRDGEMHSFYDVARREKSGGNRGLFIDVWYTRSLNGRTRWTEPQCIFRGWMGGPMHPIELKSGRILLPFESWVFERNWQNPGTGPWAFSYSGQFISTAEYSDDGGKSWIRTNDIQAPVPDTGTIGANEPSAIELKDGRIWLLTRTQMGRFYESYSYDSGAHWSVARPSHFISSDSPHAFARLNDGRIVIVWNDCLRFPYAYGGRQVLHAAISEDEGATWHGYREIYRDPHRGDTRTKDTDYGTGYPYVMTTKTGKVFVTQGAYDAESTVLFDPQWLYETHQADDFSQGVDGWSIYGVKGVELVPHAVKAGAKVLSIRRADREWPAAAVWNFPAGKKGQVNVRLQLKPGFRGAEISVADHYSTPFDLEAELYALYHLHIGQEGLVGNSTQLDPGRWYAVTIKWDAAQNEAVAYIDGRRAAVLPQQHPTESGPNYLRLRAMSEDTSDAGFLVESVAADTSGK
jgi:hypothetical protein